MQLYIAMIKETKNSVIIFSTNERLLCTFKMIESFEPNDSHSNIFIGDVIFHLQKFLILEGLLDAPLCFVISIPREID